MLPNRVLEDRYLALTLDHDIIIGHLNGEFELAFDMRIHIARIVVV